MKSKEYISFGFEQGFITTLLALGYAYRFAEWEYNFRFRNERCAVSWINRESDQTPNDPK